LTRLKRLLKKTAKMQQMYIALGIGLIAVGILILVYGASWSSLKPKVALDSNNDEQEQNCIRMTGNPLNDHIYSLGPFRDNVYPGYRGAAFEDVTSVTNDELAGKIVKGPKECIQLGCMLPGAQGVNYETETGRCVPILKSQRQLAPNDKWNREFTFEDRIVGRVPIRRHHYFAWELHTDLSNPLAELYDE
jgi:hypothetical protein